MNNKLRLYRAKVDLINKLFRNQIKSHHLTIKLNIKEYIKEAVKDYFVKKLHTEREITKN
jgi:hypothetical protein